MKCDNCKFMYAYTLGPDECGAGNGDAICTKDHWHGLGPVDEDDVGTYWDDCEDFEEVEK